MVGWKLEHLLAPLLSSACLISSAPSEHEEKLLVLFLPLQLLLDLTVCVLHVSCWAEADFTGLWSLTHCLLNQILLLYQLRIVINHCSLTNHLEGS